MNNKKNQTSAIKAICPACKKISDFSVRDEIERRSFNFRPHDCPNVYCRKRFLTGWVVIKR